MLEYVRAGRPTGLWSAARIREDSPVDAQRITDDELGVLFHSGNGDGALLIGTRDELIEGLESVLAALRVLPRLLDPIDGELAARRELGR